MAGKRIVQASVSIAAVAIGIAISNRILPRAKAMSLSEESSIPPLNQQTHEVLGADILLSSISSTILREPADNFEYHLASDPAPATEAVRAYAVAVEAGDAEDILVALFLNATMAGSMTDAQASDWVWKCNELSGEMAKRIAACKDVEIVRRGLVGEEF